MYASIWIYFLSLVYTRNVSITLSLGGNGPHCTWQLRWWTIGNGWCVFKLVSASAISAAVFSQHIFAYPGCTVDVDVSLFHLPQHDLQNQWHLRGSDVSAGGVVVDFDAVTWKKKMLVHSCAMHPLHYCIQGLLSCLCWFSMIHNPSINVKLTRKWADGTCLNSHWLTEVEDAYLFPPNPHVLEDRMLLWALAVCCHFRRPLKPTCQGCPNRTKSCDEMFCVFQWLFSQRCTVRDQLFPFKRRLWSWEKLCTLRTRGPSSTSIPPSPSSWLGSREPFADEYRNLYYFGGYP